MRAESPGHACTPSKKFGAASEGQNVQGLDVAHLVEAPDLHRAVKRPAIQCVCALSEDQRLQSKCGRGVRFESRKD